MSVNATTVGWEQLGSEVLMGRYIVPEWVKAQALDKLVPQEQLSIIVSKPEACKPKRRWNMHVAQHKPNRSPQLQVESRWRRQYGCNTARYFLSICDAQVSLMWHLQGECAKLATGGDWDGVHVVNSAIMTLAKGKGERKGAAKGGERNEPEKCWTRRKLV